jgi:hypothetical protein
MVGISDLLDSDVENSRDAPDNSILSNSSNIRESATKPRRKRRGVTMPRAKSKIAKPAAAEKKRPATKRATAAKRKAVEETVEDPTDADGDEIQETQAPSPVPRARGNAKRKAAVREESKEESDNDDMEIDQTPVVVQSSHAPARGRKAVPKPVHKDAELVTKAKTASKRKADLTSRADTLVDSEDEDEMQMVENLPPKATSRALSRNHQTDAFRRRAGSASDTERGDPNLRRKLGDITRKYENIDLKYRNLREVGLSEANANMDKLRKQSEATTQASNELIASLKKELSQQAPLVQESRKLQRQVQTNELELVELRKTNSTISSTLTAANNEIKALQAKLNAMRSSSVAAETLALKGPGSAARQPNTGRTGVLQPAENALAAQMKEELYRDLTGLIVQGVKRSEEGDTYNCYQTGRNGSKYSSHVSATRLTHSFSASLQAVY